MAELTMFVYPWDVLDEEPESLVAELAGRGVRRIAVATAYHSAEVLRPRRRKRVNLLIEPNVVHTPINTGRFGLLTPRLGALAGCDVFPRLAKAAAAAGIGLTGWTVVLHHSDLAQRHPDLAGRNCFGDNWAHGLCPSQPEVARYAVELCAALGETGYFDTLMLESLAYPMAGHGHPHQLSAVRLDPVGRLLRSLCFCSACLVEGERIGVDGTALADWVAETLATSWNGPLAAARTADEGQEVAAALVRRPDLYAWVRMRNTVVTGLFERITTRLRPSGVATVAAVAGFGQPAPMTWQEGHDIEALSRVCDGLTLLAYAPDPAGVAREIDYVTGLVPAANVQVVQTFLPHQTSTVDNLMSIVEHCADAGIDRIGLYNWGLAPAGSLGWVNRVAALIASWPPTGDGPGTTVPAGRTNPREAI
ncbi:hypothetical protein [Dactylosporangium sp. NPDC048998]|uniref:hypothetical protein n=1 Tax=Dactylosporangium sp. NPDC048998 TaxID=3363976 RepID=UPI0037126C2B